MQGFTAPMFRLPPTAWVGLAKGLVLAVCTAMLVTEGSQRLGMGCPSTFCWPNDPRYGLSLFLGCLALAWFGQAVLRWSGSPQRCARIGLVFPAIVAGLAVLVVYVYVRSLFNHLVVDLPISGWEMGVGMLSLGAWAVLYPHKTPTQANRTPARAWVLDLLLLLLLCLWVADREMPRVVMLSNDPDFHAFFGQQIERFGAIPYQQREWGDQGFNYPAGSGVLLFLWNLVSGLDHRNLITALPVLFAGLAALVVADSASSALRSASHRWLVQWLALALVASAWTFPLYAPYAHMEGVGRQMSYPFVALFIYLAVAQFTQPLPAPPGRVALSAAVFFVLVILNPANIVVPAGLLFALWVFRLAGGRWSFEPVLALILGIGLLLLDPYFQNLLNIVEHARTDTVGYADSFVIKPFAHIAGDAIRIWTQEVRANLWDLSNLLFETRYPVFLSLLLVFSASLWVVYRGAWPPATFWWTLGALVVSLYLVYGLAKALIDDRRFYLLAPYIHFNMAQFKALLLVLLASAVVAGLAAQRMHRLLLIAVAVVCFLPAHHMVRSHQDMLLDPRRDYCGANGCIPQSDLDLLARLERMRAAGELHDAQRPAPKVLLANAVAQMGIETWVFPVSSARLFPFYNILPAAFFYYQGDVDYGTRSYQAHVCDRLDRTWLHQKGIVYVYLPSVREGVCIQGLDDLIRTETVVAQEGDAYLLRLNPL